MFFLLVINPCARRAIEEYTYHISHPSVRLGINIPNEPITIRIMPFSQYLYPSFTWVFHTFGEFRITIGRLLVFRLLVVLDSPMNLPLQHCGSRRFRSFRRLRSCRLRCIAKVALEQGLSRLMRVSGNGYTMVHRKKKTNNLAKYGKIWWFILIYFKRKPHETWHLFSLHNWRNHPFDDVETSLDHLVLEPLRHVQPNLVFIILSHCHESVAQNVGNKIHLGQFLASVHLVFCRWQHPIIQSA